MMYLLKKNVRGKKTKEKRRTRDKKILEWSNVIRKIYTRLTREKKKIIIEL